MFEFIILFFIGSDGKLFSDKTFSLHGGKELEGFFCSSLFDPRILAH